MQSSCRNAEAPIPIFEDANCDVCGSWDSKELVKLQGSAYHECNTCGLIFARPMPINFVELNEASYHRKLDKYIEKIQKRRSKNRKKVKPFSRY